MTFTGFLANAVNTKALISVDLNLEVITEFFENVCNKLDDLEKKMKQFEQSAPAKDDLNGKMKDILEKLEKHDNQISDLDDNAKKNKQETDKKIKELEDRIDGDIGKCIIDCRNLTKDALKNAEPEIIKNVMNALPNLDNLLSENKNLKDELDDLKKRINALETKSPRAGTHSSSSSSSSSSSGKKEKKQNDDDDKNKFVHNTPRSEAGSAVSDQDIQSITDDINERMRNELNKLRDQMKQYTDDQINNLFGRNDEQGKNLAVDVANAIRIANSAKDKAEELSQDFDSRLAQYDDKFNDFMNESSISKNKINDKLKDLGIFDEQLDQKIADLQRMIDGIDQTLHDQSLNCQQLQKAVIADDGEIDLSPLFHQLNNLDGKLAILNEKVAVLEGKETVHPLTVDSIKDKVDVLDQQLQNLTAKLGQFESDQLNTKDRIRDCENAAKRNSNTIDNLTLSNEKNKAGIESLKQAVDSLYNRINDHKKLIDGLSTNLDDVVAKQTASLSTRRTTSAKDSRVDGLVEQVRNLEKDLANVKQKLAVAWSTIEQLTSKVDDLENNPGYYNDVNDIRNEIKQLWGKIQELTQLQNEIKDDFLPKIDLSRPVQNRTVTERVALPRIAYPKSPNKDDPRVSDTALKVEKQENILYQLRRAVEQHQKNIAALDENKADKQATQQLFEQFRIALGELNNRFGTLKRAIIGKVDAADLTNYINQAIGKYDEDETSTGTEPIKCLCCGKPRRNVTGAMDDPTLAKRLGAPMSTRVIGDGDGQVCFVYGERGDMYYGRSGTGKPIFSKPPESQA